jgi:hypothetical protein
MSLESLAQLGFLLIAVMASGAVSFVVASVVWRALTALHERRSPRDAAVNELTAAPAPSTSMTLAPSHLGARLRASVTVRMRRP